MKPVTFPISLRATSVPAQAIEAVTGRARPSFNDRSMLEPGELLRSPCNPLLPGLGFCDPHVLNLDCVHRRSIMAVYDAVEHVPPAMTVQRQCTPRDLRR
jgi:hypothetical protein